MTMQYTQGPWWFETKWCDRVNSDDGAICIITEDNAKGVNRTKLVNRANARLIAAAPDLLEACIAIANGYKHKGEEMVRAAIAKATGEQA